MLVPMYNAELAPPGIRGSLVALQQLAITFGILIAYWIGYGTNCEHGSICVMLIPSHRRDYCTGSVLGCLEDPTRSADRTRHRAMYRLLVLAILTSMADAKRYVDFFKTRPSSCTGREDECLQGLSNLRRLPASDPKVQYEYRGLLAERLTEKEAAVERYGAEELNWRVSFWEYKRLLTTKTLLHRLSIGAGAQFFQQWTGINGESPHRVGVSSDIVAIIYYAPIIFVRSIRS